VWPQQCAAKTAPEFMKETEYLSVRGSPNSSWLAFSTHAQHALIINANTSTQRLQLETYCCRRYQLR
jgi:hypothetical protein